MDRRKTIGDVKVKYHEFSCVDQNGREFKESIPYVCMEDIPKNNREDFDKWMYGQTIPCIEGEKDPIYAWDWERWYNRKKNNIF